MDDLHNWPASRCFLPESASPRMMEHLPVLESSMLTSYGKKNHENKDSRHSELACEPHTVKLGTLLRASTHANSFGRTHYNGSNMNKWHATNKHTRYSRFLAGRIPVALDHHGRPSSAGFCPLLNSQAAGLLWNLAT
jgi:hypothetical protein